MTLDGDGNSQAAASIAASTTSGVLAATDIANRAGGDGSTKEQANSQHEPARETISQKPKGAKAKSQKTALGTPQERLEILQEAAKMFQEAGGVLRVGNPLRDGMTVIVIAIPNAIVADGQWKMLTALYPSPTPPASVSPDAGLT